PPACCSACFSWWAWSPPASPCCWCRPAARGGEDMARSHRRFALAALVLCAAAGMLYGLARLSVAAPPTGDAGGPADFTDPALVARGAYVARLGDCAGCHTARQPGSKPFAGGQPMHSPFGII